MAATLALQGSKRHVSIFQSQKNGFTSISQIGFCQGKVARKQRKSGSVQVFLAKLDTPWALWECYKRIGMFIGYIEINLQQKLVLRYRKMVSQFIFSTRETAGFAGVSLTLRNEEVF